MARRPLRAVLVARVSTVSRSQDASPGRQLAELRDVAKRRGWSVVGTFTDRSTGAETGPGLRAALRLARRGGADVLAVTAVDRLGRDVRQMLEHVDGLHQAGARLYVRDDEIDTVSPEGRLQFTLLCTLAEFQRRANLRGVIAGIAHARKKGVRLGRRPELPRAAIARAAELRRQRPPPSWAAIARQLRAEKLGRHDRTSLSWAVGNLPSKRRPKNPRKARRRVL